jgi:hypothetical protein
MTDVLRAIFFDTIFERPASNSNILLAKLLSDTIFLVMQLYKSGIWE